MTCTVVFLCRFQSFSYVPLLSFFPDHPILSQPDLFSFAPPHIPIYAQHPQHAALACALQLVQGFADDANTKAELPALIVGARASLAVGVGMALGCGGAKVPALCFERFFDLCFLSAEYVECFCREPPRVVVRALCKERR